MKKILALALVLITCFSFAACSSEDDVADSPANQPAQEDNGRIEATEFDFTVEPEKEIIVENQIFNKPVTITGDFGEISFVNCEFNADIINAAEQFTRVKIQSDCNVNGKCIVKNTLKEGTIDTPLPKFMTTVPIDFVCEDCLGAVAVLGDFDITFNGENVSLTDSELYFDNANPDAGYVPYEGQEASFYMIGQWWENGEKVVFTECES